jgi:hypothetical protein
MSVRERSILLDQGTTLPARIEPGSMLIGIYRDEFTDFLYIRIRVDDFTFDLDTPRPPKTRAQAVDLARGLLRALQFPGRVKWQLGGAGAVTDEPRI